VRIFLLYLKKTLKRVPLILFSTCSTHTDSLSWTFLPRLVFEAWVAWGGVPPARLLLQRYGPVRSACVLTWPSAD
jgi:hypothetical protein